MMQPGRSRRPLSSSSPPWHALSSEDAARELGVDPEKGLAATEVRRRLAAYGPNRLAEPTPTPLWHLVARQFESALILILIGAAGLAFAIGHHLDAVVILFVVSLNAVLGYLQERRAEQATAALERMLAVRSRVRREGEVERIDASGLVPGDVVLLDAGDRVPADGRLVEAHALEIDESTLTGESLPVAKRAGAVLAETTALADRHNLAFMNCLVTRGRGELLVTATGLRTEIGRVATLLEEAEPAPTPLEVQLDRLGKRIAAIAGVAVALVFGFGLLRGEPLGDLVLTSIALAVAAIPEGLPAVVTVTLALGMHRMARNRAIVKRLGAVETLGCTTLICSDKTGTLTRNRMSAHAVFTHGQRVWLEEEHDPNRAPGPDEGESVELQPLLVAVALCHDSHENGGQWLGDPTEVALVELAARAGVDPRALESRLPRLAELPFDAETKLMATVHAEGEDVRLVVKGAFEEVLCRCSAWLGPAGLAPLQDAGPLTGANEGFAAQALRVLAVASRTIPASRFRAQPDPHAHLENLTFVGLVGLRDAPRPEARPALALCRRAGIAVKMITGDHVTTAATIARELGLAGSVVSGADLDHLDSAELADRLDSIGVFARVRPDHKVQIVRAARARGHVVAMTGDGVNDAPALKSADIGVAMGRGGTEVAKEAATMVLADDNFATIVGAIREGRTIYDNIGKFVRFQLSTNLGAILSVFSAPLLGLPLPFNPIQILWVNIIMDGPPALALGLDPPSPHIMEVPPRSPEERVLSLERIARLAATGLWMAAGTLGVLAWALRNGPVDQALTLAFTTFVLFQLFNALNVRSERDSVWCRQLASNWRLWCALAGVLTLQLLAANWGPAQQIFATAELDAAQFCLAAGVASTIVLMEEVRKGVARWIGRRSR